MTRGGGQRGQTLAMFAVAMLFMFVGLIALVGDADVLMVQYNRVNAAALIGVQAGTTAIDLGQFYAGVRTLDPGQAQTRCETAADQVLQTGNAAHCQVNGVQVTADVS